MLDRWLHLADWIDALTEWLGRTISWLTLGMVILTFLVATLRYLFGVGWIALQESVVYLHAVTFMLAVGYALKHHDHVRVDLFYHRLSWRGRHWVDLIGTALLLLPVGVALIWISWGYVADSWQWHESSREAGGLPLVWVLKGVMLMMPVLLIIQAVAQAIRSLAGLLRPGTATLP